MTIPGNKLRPGGFIASEASDHCSRDEIVILGGSGILPAGMVLGKVLATGKYVPSPNTGADGSELAMAVLYGEVDASAGDAIGAAVTRDAEVRARDLTYHDSVDTDAKVLEKRAQLFEFGIVV